MLAGCHSSELKVLIPRSLWSGCRSFLGPLQVLKLLLTVQTPPHEVRELHIVCRSKYELLSFNGWTGDLSRAKPRLWRQLGLACSYWQWWMIEKTISLLDAVASNWLLARDQGPLEWWELKLQRLMGVTKEVRGGPSWYFVCKVIYLFRLPLWEAMLWLAPNVVCLPLFVIC